MRATRFFTGEVPSRDRLELVRRYAQLVIGLAAFGFGIALMARAQLGLGPWSAFHDGVGRHSGMPLGTVEMVLSLPILAAWLLLRERPGPGTVLSPFVLGGATNVGLGLVSPASELPAQVSMMLLGTLVVAVGSALYLGADLGPGPRDGLMTGVQRRFGWRLAPVRTGLELTVLGIGWLLGGAIGVGTLAYAFTIGPILTIALRWLGAHDVLRPPARGQTAPPSAAPRRP